MWRSPTKIPIPWIFKHVSRHVSICKRSLIRWPSSKDTILVYQGGFSTALWGKRLKSASEKCIQRGRWEVQQREEAKEIPSRKRAQMYITAGSDVGAHVQGQARVWRSYRQTPADSQQENLDSPTTRNWILPTIWKIFCLNFIAVELIYNVLLVSGVTLKDLRSGFFPRSSR